MVNQVLELLQSGLVSAVLVCGFLQCCGEILPLVIPLIAQDLSYDNILFVVDETDIDAEDIPEHKLLLELVLGGDLPVSNKTGGIH